MSKSGFDARIEAFEKANVHNAVDWCVGLETTVVEKDTDAKVAFERRSRGSVRDLPECISGKLQHEEHTAAPNSRTTDADWLGAISAQEQQHPRKECASAEYAISETFWFHVTSSVLFSKREK